MPDSVTVFGANADVVLLDRGPGHVPVAMHGISFAKPHAPESLLPRYAVPVPGAVNIGIMHTSLGALSGDAMAFFRNAVVSLPGAERIARTPFGAKIVIHATAAETGGTFGMRETYTPPGDGPAPHTHTRETEVFRVIRGNYLFRCGDQEFEAPPGAVVALPPYVEHSWRNIGEEPGQMSCTVTHIEATGADTPEKVAVIEARLGIINDVTIALGLNLPKGPDD